MTALCPPCNPLKILCHSYLGHGNRFHFIEAIHYVYFIIELHPLLQRVHLDLL